MPTISGGSVANETNLRQARHKSRLGYCAQEHLAPSPTAELTPRGRGWYLRCWTGVCLPSSSTVVTAPCDWSSPGGNETPPRPTRLVGDGRHQRLSVGAGDHGEVDGTSLPPVLPAAAADRQTYQALPDSFPVSGGRLQVGFRHSIVGHLPRDSAFQQRHFWGLVLLKIACENLSHKREFIQNAFMADDASPGSHWRRYFRGCLHRCPLSPFVALCFVRTQFR
jgi:hypothetical protein